jgi:hypothetical protein
MPNRGVWRVSDCVNKETALCSGGVIEVRTKKEEWAETVLPHDVDYLHTRYSFL